ncbi:uncharacterized protein VTP21DRAFT_9179 [Calcarisporiella thermophila]|uniref:uncharacterized protein n=1 Tax=Calcarisporiella thermophila TaxID=911321 RepID=UPI0037420580
MRSALALSVIALVGLLSTRSEAAPLAEICPSTYSLTLFYSPNHEKRLHYTLVSGKCNPIPAEARTVYGFNTGPSIETLWFENGNCGGLPALKVKGSRPRTRFTAGSFISRCAE